MINADKIKGKIVENKYNMSTFALAMGIHRETLKLKLSGKRQFNAEEVAKAKVLLHLTAEETVERFLITKEE